MESTGHKLIITIVNKGKAVKIAEATRMAGANGGTIILGHGIAVPLLLGIAIEPEKDILLTIVEEDIVQRVTDAIIKEGDLTQTNKGIVFVLSTEQVAGIYQGDNK